ncbi:hypothetical protein TWF751_002441 [Orbilia oligospora]|uniref:Uncharacterized protein n=1 Tax=Orbilia oligospora TaxID=2813651 RepID=A0A7C8K2G0_ORBOL|nr:hypothetical protein TWF703_000063 [Orbilia oligospora]KAF3157333.1 hypothetical protein TWF751_002441 [Orbilia oligospora]
MCLYRKAFYRCGHVLRKNIVAQYCREGPRNQGHRAHECSYAIVDSFCIELAEDCDTCASIHALEQKVWALNGKFQYPEHQNKLKKHKRELTAMKVQLSRQRKMGNFRTKQQIEKGELLQGYNKFSIIFKLEKAR